MQPPKLPIVTIFYKGFSSLSSLHGRLYLARKAFLQTGHKVRERLTEQEDGVTVTCRYRLTKRSFLWEKRADKALLERAYKVPGGYYLDVFDGKGVLRVRTEYDREHLFYKASFYSESGRPEVLLSAVAGKEGLTLSRWDGDTAQYIHKPLFLSPLHMGTAEQSVIDSIVGEPQIITACMDGDYCCCEEAEHQQRLTLWEQVERGELSLQPSFVPNQDKEIEEPEEPKQPQHSEPLPEPEIERSLVQERLRELERSVTAEQSSPEPKVEVSFLQQRLRELEQQLPRLSAEESAQDDAETKKVAPDLEKHSTQPDVPLQEEAPTSYSINRELFRKDTVSPPTRYFVAKKSVDGKVSAPGLPASQTTETEPLSASEESVSTQREPVDAAAHRELPAKNIVISRQESYRYFGQMLEEMRHGRGRTEMPDGRTAYEGMYEKDKRHGFGAYYYKTGQLCYAGDWQNNRRDGIGVGFRPAGGGLYAGTWRQDRPDGAGAVIEPNGNISYAGGLQNGKRHGVGASYRAQDGMLLVGQWRGDVFTGQVTVFDPEGRLCYSGGWKDGKRHGMGTQYLPNGQIGVVGLWDEDNLQTGVMYRDGVPSALSGDAVLSEAEREEKE